jgi:hypothetical protein
MPDIKTVLHLEIFSITKQNSTNFRILYKEKGQPYYQDFYISQAELLHMLNEKGFCPFYCDNYHLLQFTGTSLRFVDISENCKQIYIPFREKELFVEFNKVLNLDPEIELDLLPAFLDSLEKAKPNVNETIVDQAKETCELEGILPYLDRVRQIAKNSSGGYDDAIDLYFMKDIAPRSLYWVISRDGKQLMNGGIIWHSESCSWEIHT